MKTKKKPKWLGMAETEPNRNRRNIRPHRKSLLENNKFLRGMNTEQATV